MSILDRLFGRTSESEPEVTPDVSLDATPDVALGSTDNPITSFDVFPNSSQPYELFSVFADSGLQVIANQNPWVGAAIRLNKQFCSRVPLAIKDKNKEELIPAEDGPFEFLNMPNSYQTFRELLEGLSFWYDVLGESFIYMKKSSPMAIPDEIHCIPPYLLQLRTGTGDATPRWYFHSVAPSSPESFPIEPYELIHIKNFGYHRSYGGYFYNAYGNPMRGVSPALPLMPTLATDRKASAFIDAYTGGKTLLSGVLKPAGDSRMAHKQVEQNLQRLTQQINNFNESQKLLMLQNNMEWIESNFRPFDVPFMEIKNITKEEVCATYGVNPILLGDFKDIQSYEGIKSAEKIYYHVKIIPRLDDIAYHFYHNLFKFINGGQLSLAFDFSKIEALDDYDVRLERALKALEAGRTPDEVNEMFHLGFPDSAGEHGKKPLPQFREQAVPMLGPGDNKKQSPNRDSGEPNEQKDTDRKRKRKED